VERCHLFVALDFLAGGGDGRRWALFSLTVWSLLAFLFHTVYHSCMTSVAQDIVERFHLVIALAFVLMQEMANGWAPDSFGILLFLYFSI